MRRLPAVRTALAVVLAASLAGCWWAQPGYNSHRTGFNPHVHAITAANAATLEIDWTGPPMLGHVSDVVRSSAGSLHLLEHTYATSTITTLDPGDGSVEWTVDVDDAHGSTLLAAGDELLVPTYRPATEPHGCLRRIDASDGADLGCHSIAVADPSVVPALSSSDLATVVSGDWAVTRARYFAGGAGDYLAWLSVTNLADPAKSWDAAVPRGPHEWATHPLIVGATVVMATTPDDVDETLLHRWPLACPGSPCTPTSDPLAVPIGTELAANADGTRLAVLGYGGGDDPDLEVVDLATGTTIWTADVGTNIFPIGRPTWTPTALLAVVIDLDTPGDVIASFSAEGCGSSTCQPDWTAPRNLGGASQIVGAADIVAFRAGYRALVVMAAECAPTCDPLYEYADDTNSPEVQPIITDGRILTLVQSPEGPRLAAFAPGA